MVLYDPSVWGPHFWFFLDTIAMTYPKHPNAVTKKIYYDFIQHFHLFIPVAEHSKNFNKLSFDNVNIIKLVIKVL